MVRLLGHDISASFHSHQTTAGPTWLMLVLWTCSFKQPHLWTTYILCKARRFFVVTFLLSFIIFGFPFLHSQYGARNQKRNQIPTHYRRVGTSTTCISLFVPFLFFLFSWFYDGMQGLQCPRECIYHTIIWYLTSKALHKEGHMKGIT